jgi:hypothetical protein
MVFKVLLVAALLAFVLGDDNVLQFVRSKPEWKFSLNSLLAEDVHLTLYDSVNCTGSDIGNLQCDGKTCQDLARLKSVKVRIIREIRLYIIEFFRSLALLVL